MTGPRPQARTRTRYAVLVALLAMVGLVGITWAPAAQAEDPGALTVSKDVTGWQDGQVVEPGDQFVYTITITCSNIGSGGCTNAVLTDPLPDGISFDPDSSVTVQGASADVDTSAGQFTVTFTEPLSDPVGGQGLPDGGSVTVLVPVVVDPDISPELDGQDLTNTVVVDGTNTAPVDAPFTVVPDVPVNLTPTTSKTFAPASAVASPGTPTTLTLTGSHDSNVAVDAITITDPSDPTATPNAFTYLGLSSPTLDVTMPAGAEQVEVDVFVSGTWIEGTPGPAPATIPSGVDPEAVTGIRVTFLSIDDEGIPPAAGGAVDVPLEQRGNIADAGEGPIDNQVSTTVTAGTESSDPATASASYVITSSELPVAAAKTFEPDAITVGGTSTVTLSGTNTSDQTLDSMSITEPSAAPNPFENGLTFTGWADEVVWPNGATGATVTYQLADGSTVALDADAPNTLPDPPAGAEVVGFTVEFTGPIVPGAEATVPFIVTADENQVRPEVEHPNEIGVETTAPGGFSGDATATDVLTSIERRLAVDVEKRIEPSQVFSIPGQLVTVLLSGTLEPFPASSTDATEIIVQDPADFANDAWYDTFAPTTISETPIPADSTLTVQYWDGTEWVDVPGMVDVPGPEIFTGDLPPEVSENAQGIRFVYHSDDGFPPGTQVSPNITFELRPGAAGQDIEVEDCAASSASAPDAPPANEDMANCPVINLVPPDPGNADFIDKSWDSPQLVGERTGNEAGTDISWSTSGASNIDQMYISDIPNPSTASVPDTVFDSFDLMRIDPITPAMDPHLTYDRVARVELFSLAANDWVDAPDDPCPEACDGTFPGYTLSAGSRADTAAFRLVFEESPTRDERIGGDPSAPPVGSGVARSVGNDRDIHPVFQIRDDLRSDPDVPVVSDAVYNVDGQPSEVSNTARASVIVDGSIFVDQDASDIITISPVPVTVTLTKDWTGGPLGVPPPGTPFPEDWPTGRMTLDAENTTPRQIDRLTITEPTGASNPFDTFNLRGFVSITDPGSIGADDATVTLDLADGSTRELSPEEALAAAEADLTEVVGYSVVYTGRIDAGAHAVVVSDTRLRPTTRADGAPVEPGTTVDNRATTVGADLVNYPGVVPVTSTDADTAGIALQEVGISLDVTKTFAPDEQTEPDRSTVTMTLSGQPNGPSRTTEMVLTDEDASFWNQYDFVDFGADFAFTAPIDRVEVDVLTGGTFVEQGGGVELQDATWVEGDPAIALTLPEGVSADDVQGLRFTFAREDGLIWENPATPRQDVPVQIQRRETLNTGGPVPSDLAGNSPAPGETNPGEATNSITGDNFGADLVGGEPIHGTADAEAMILYRHARDAVVVTKSPSGAQAPGESIPYAMTFTNTGEVPIIDPVITDRLPSDAEGPTLILNPDTEDHYTYALDGAPPDPANGSPMPTDPAEVTVDDVAAGLRFTFPTGTVLEVGQTYTITVDMVFRPGLPGNTQVTNTVGIVGDRPWDECETTLDPASGECRSATTVYPTRAGALRGTKEVRAVDDELGVLDTRASGCAPDADGFFDGGCVPVTKPGGEEVWRMTFTNTGNLPMDKLYALDRLPAVGDSGAIVDLPRESEWAPVPKSVRLVGADLGTISEIRIYYDADEDLCTADLETQEGCPEGEWTLIEQAPDPADGWSVAVPESARALKLEMDFADEMLQPTGNVQLDLTTTTPAQSSTAGADTIAWNTVAQAGETNDGGALVLAPASEGNKVGVALATGPLEVRKRVAGPASEHAPDTFILDVSCTSAGQQVDLGDQASITVTAGETTRIDDVPWGSECTVVEDTDTSGTTHFEATTVTVGRDNEPVSLVRATNTYDDASLVLTKTTSESAVDQAGNPVSYGPFEFDVDCTFLGEPVYAAGYGPLRPMTASFMSGQEAAFNEIPAGSQCVATETDTAGAAGTTSTGSSADGDVTGGTTIELVLTSDEGEGVATNEVTFDNLFEVGSLVVNKVVEGAGAEQYGAGPFTIHLSCTDPEGRPVWDGDIMLGGESPLSATVEDVYAGATCIATETATGGATTSSVSPDGPFEIDSGEPVTVTASNTFALGSVQVTKRLEGDGVRNLGPNLTFTVDLACTREVDGVTEDVPIRNDGERSLSRSRGMVATYVGLPLGAACVVTEPDDGGADDTTISPARLTVGGDDAAEVVVTNTFDAGRDDRPEDPGNDVDPDDGPGDGDQPPAPGPESHTGGAVLDDHDGLLVGALAALSVALAGAFVLALRRRS